MMQSPDTPTPTSPTFPNTSTSPTSPTVRRGPSNHARQASASTSSSQWRREEMERPSVNGTSNGRYDSYLSSRQDGYPSRHDSYIAPRPDDFPRQDSHGSNMSPSHSRTGSGDAREARERARESNRFLHRSPTAPAAPVKPSAPPIQEKVRGPEKLVKSKSRRDKEMEREREREASRRTSPLAPSGPSKLRSKTADMRAEQDPPRGALNPNPSTRRARPISEVTVEPTEQLRAQGAWEHAKILGIRGQSVVMPDKFSVAPPPPQTMPHAQGQYQPPVGSPPPQYPQSQHHQNGHLPRAAAGSSHTQFVVQPPFQEQAQSQQQQPPRLGAWPAYQYRQYAYYPPQQRQTQPVDPNPLPAPPAQINYPPQRVNR